MARRKKKSKDASVPPLFYVASVIGLLAMIFFQISSNTKEVTGYELSESAGQPVPEVLPAGMCPDATEEANGGSEGESPASE